MKLLPLLLFVAATACFGAATEYPKMGPDLYDPTADGNVQIAAALKQAKAEHKHVLLMFGANWCIWCRRLHHTFESVPAVTKALNENHVLVLIDVNMRHGVKRNDEINTRYGNPIKEGLPVFVVLDADGKQLATQESGALENDKEGHDPAKVIAFLQQWAPKK
jgi:thioredoxin-related protein